MDGYFTPDDSLSQPTPMSQGLMSRTLADDREDGRIVRVLVVEDDDFMRKTIELMLKSIEEKSAAMHEQLSLPPPFKLQIECTRTGEQGWDMLRSRRFHIALIDLNLPGVSGLELAWCYQQLLPDAVEEAHMSVDEHAAPQQPTILIACSSNLPTGPEGEASLAEYGVHDVLPKPVNIKALRHLLHKWLPRGDDVVMDPELGHPGPTTGLERNNSGSFASRILIVEDCVVTRTATMLVFQQLGQYAEVAADGGTAMAMLDKRNFDLILLDVDLPDMSGYAISTWYKSLCRSRGSTIGKVVAVTSDPDSETCREFEMDACLPKPLTTLSVMEALQNFWRTPPTSPSTSKATATATP
uniref:Response regulatory domain-containing protein n=1 Tax=Haptolina brevifila TaxID=156173 RepID=A0A6U7HFG2_9EUKA|mmetsp:Transcript_53632/g.106723  ORF Transcript_53632/g.106723 Transcript_53632/m.106723 type:complete len:355 (+) Transcript_53632:67-1131(+)|eukprot:CAMPEP_0174720296 /NCGR_PEP_ID=MMETSP1094-20130205/33233_1 /TAXON_ID=156173 /ORGANISM="Chrysochromulina brevifilum, Strain UTEX LB 985" /LENGTH=354 /DNA_ID=CAMNT_0015920761 /DNA_START=48 /DNA_END=1112 /DNA_ORIENTATION=+